LIYRHFSWAILTGGSDGVRACANDLGEGCSAIEADRVGAMDAVEHAADLAGGSRWRLRGVGVWACAGA
jgi:hypothetical protein